MGALNYLLPETALQSNCIDIHVFYAITLPLRNQLGDISQNLFQGQGDRKYLILNWSTCSAQGC